MTFQEAWNSDEVFELWLKEQFRDDPLFVYEALREQGLSDEEATKYCEDPDFFDDVRYVVENKWWDDNKFRVQDLFKSFIRRTYGG